MDYEIHEVLDAGIGHMAFVVDFGGVEYGPFRSKKAAERFARRLIQLLSSGDCRAGLIPALQRHHKEAEAEEEKRLVAGLVMVIVFSSVMADVASRLASWWENAPEDLGDYFQRQRVAKKDPSPGM